MTAWIEPAPREGPIRSASDDPSTIRSEMAAALRAERDVPLDTDDFVSALLDVWAEASAGIGFYEQLLASEAYIGSADDPAAVHDVAQLLGHEPAPAVAASTVLSLVIRTTRPSTRGAGDEIDVEAGLQVQSVPRNGEAPRTFETSDDVTVCEAWSALRPALPPNAPFVVTGYTTVVSIAANDHKPKPGDGLLFSERSDLNGATEQGPSRAGTPMFRVIRAVQRRRVSVKAGGNALGMTSPDPQGGYDVHLEPTLADQSHLRIVDPIVELFPIQTVPFGASADVWNEAPDEAREPVGTRQGWIQIAEPGRGWKPDRDGLPEMNVLCLAVDERDDAILAGTDGDGVYRLAAGSRRWDPLGTGLEGTKITALTVGDQRIYAGTSDERVHLFDDETSSWDAMGDRVQRSRHSRRTRLGPKHEPFPRGPIRSLLAANLFGRHLLFAGTDRGVFRWMNANRGWVGRSPGLPNWDLDTAHATVWALAIDDVVFDLFAATNDGVYRSRTLGASWHRRTPVLDGGAQRANDLVVTSAPKRRRRTMFVATDQGVEVTSNGGKSWTSTGAMPHLLPPVRCVTARSHQHVIAGGRRGTGRWSPDERPSFAPPPAPPRIVGWTPSDAPEPTDPNLRHEPMADVWALEENARGRRVAAMARLDFLEYDWPHFWIHFPTLDVVPQKEAIVEGTSIVLRNRLGTDVLATSIRTIPPAPNETPGVERITRHDYGLTAEVQRLSLQADDADTHRLRERFPIRHTDVYAGGVVVEAGDEPTARIDALCGDRVVLAAGSVVPPIGRYVAITGTAARLQIDALGGVEESVDGSIRSAGLAWHDVTALGSGHDGRLLAAAEGALWRRQGAEESKGSEETSVWRWIRLPAPPLAGPPRSVAEHPDGNVIVVINNRVWSWNPPESMWRPDQNELPDPTSDVLTIDMTGTWWALSGGGLWSRESIASPWEPARSEMSNSDVDLDSVAAHPEGGIAVVATDGRVLVSGPSGWMEFARVDAGTRDVAIGPTGSVFTTARSTLDVDIDVDRSTVLTVGIEELFSEQLDVSGLRDGTISASLRHRLSSTVGPIGSLRVTAHSCAVSLIDDEDHHVRYVVVDGASQARVGRLPQSLPVAEPPVDVGGGRTRWTVKIADAHATFTVPADTVSFVSHRTDDVARSELAVVREVLRPDHRSQPTIVLDRQLETCYDPITVELDANTVEATEGTTVHRDVLGSGNAEVPNQEFTLSHRHVTYVAASTGWESSVSIEVVETGHPVAVPQEALIDPGQVPAVQMPYAEGRRWMEIDDLATAGPSDRVYELRTRHGRTTVRFGDGVAGARLPSGHGNITASYRYGTPDPARLAVGQLSLLRTRPPEVVGVTNPVATSGGSAAERGDQVRRRAPASTRSLGRVVSLLDHRWFAEAFPGIEHAAVSLLASQSGQVIHLSVATADASPLDHDAPVIEELTAAMGASSAHPHQIVVQPATWQSLMVDVSVRVESDVDALDVERDIRTMFSAVYSPEFAVIGRSLVAADAIARIQRRPGVRSVDLHRFSIGADPFEVRTIVVAESARWDNERDRTVPASVTSLRPADLSVTTIGGTS